MTYISFTTSSDKLSVALKELQEDLNIKVDNWGQRLEYQMISENRVEIEKTTEGYRIFAPNLTKAIFAVAQLKRFEFKVDNLAYNFSFEKNGIMIDCSRNGVPSISYLKELIRKLAIMGHTWMMLYIEDVYEIPEEPYFGSMRGRYSKSELKELDQYALKFGIELVPSIQTLAHLNQFLQWDHEFRKYADIDDILNVTRSESKQLIERMIKNLSECFSSKIIHLGMDEAYNLGRGTYLNENGLSKSVYIMEQHLQFLVEICDKYQVQSMMWDDMFFSNNPHKNSDVLDFEIPNQMNMIYWDYYHYDQAHYQTRMSQSAKLTGKITFAGGFWRWLGFVPHHEQTIQTTLPAIQAAKESGIQDVIGTAWGDDGSESPFDTALFGLVLYAYLSVSDDYHQNDFSDWLMFYTSMDYDAWMLQDEIDYLPGYPKSDFYDANPSKYLLYQDLLLPTFMPYIETLGAEYGLHLKNINRQLREQSEGNQQVKDFYIKLTDTLELKWDLPLLIYNAYQQRDKGELQKLIDSRMRPLIDSLAVLLESRRKVWSHECKPFGFEILEHRFGGMVARVQSNIKTIENYLNGDLNVIQELEEERLDPMGLNLDKDELPVAVSYIKTERIMSRNKFSW